MRSWGTRHLPKVLLAGKFRTLFLCCRSTFIVEVSLCSSFQPSADFLNPVYQALPGHLASTGYRNPTDPYDTAVQRAFDSKGKGLLQILGDKPGSAQGFGILMSTWGERNSLFQDIYDVNRLSDGFDPSGQQVMFVDVGGGYGQKAISLKKSCPQLQGRFIVQDLPESIDSAPTVEGIEMMAHDFFTEQPIKGASDMYCLL